MTPTTTMAKIDFLRWSPDTIERTTSSAPSTNVGSSALSAATNTSHAASFLSSCRRRRTRPPRLLQPSPRLHCSASPKARPSSLEHLVFVVSSTLLGVGVHATASSASKKASLQGRLRRSARALFFPQPECLNDACLPPQHACAVFLHCGQNARALPPLSSSLPRGWLLVSPMHSLLQAISSASSMSSSSLSAKENGCSPTARLIFSRANGFFWIEPVERVERAEHSVTTALPARAPLPSRLLAFRSRAS